MRHERIAATDAQAQLGRALVGAARVAGIAASVGAHRSRPWASATFVGDQHELTLVLPRHPAIGDWVAALSDADIAVRGHLVASLAVDRIEDDGADVTVALTVLTLEER